MSFADTDTGAQASTGPSIEELKAKLAEAQANATQTEAVEAEVVETTEVMAVSDNPFQMSLPKGSTGMDAVDAMLSVAGSGNFISFPTLCLTGGNTGGNFKAASFVKDEVADEMPEGGKAFPCVFLGYRAVATGWKHKFGEGEDKEKPAFSVAAGHVNPEQIKLLTLAAKNYQFTGDKDAFNYDESDVDETAAHVRPQLELLVYDPGLDSLMVVETCSHFTSMTETMKHLREYAQADAESGMRVYHPFPCKLSGESKENSNGKFKWKTHWIEIDGDVQKHAKEFKDMWKKYEAFIDANLSNAELRNDVTNWMACGDKPMTDRVKTILQNTEAV